MASQTIENYLKAFYYGMDSNGNVNVSDLAQHLKVSMPTVNSMVKKLNEMGLVIYEKYKPLRLTEAGLKYASSVIRKHRLTEMFLVEKMGFGWEEVHDVAEQIEHIQSELFFDRMDSQLGYPEFDPHGSPIPDKNGRLPDVNFPALVDCMVGDTVTLKAISESDDSFLRFLNERNLALGDTLHVIYKEPFDNSITVETPGGQSLIFSEKVGLRLLVDKRT